MQIKYLPFVKKQQIFMKNLKNIKKYEFIHNGGYLPEPHLTANPKKNLFLE